MSSDARTRFCCRPCAVTFALLLVLCTESQAQPGQWMLGVWTETISEDHAMVGDPPGGMRRGPRTVTVYMLRITDVIAGSAAAEAGLKRGDVIESINGKTVKTPNELTRIVRGSNGVLKLSLKDRNGYKSKTIDLRGAAHRPPEEGRRCPHNSMRSTYPTWGFTTRRCPTRTAPSAPANSRRGIRVASDSSSSGSDAPAQPVGARRHDL